MDFMLDIEAKLTEWQATIDEIRDSANHVEARYVLEFERQLDLLFAKLELAQEKLDEYRDAAEGESRDELKASLEGICVEIENAIDSAWAKLG